MKSDQADDFTKDMKENLREYYLRMRPLIRECISEVLPSVCKKAWLNNIAGEPRFKRDYSAITEALLDPVNLYIKREGKLLRSLLTCITLEGYGKDPGNFKSLIGIIEVMEDSTICLDDLWDDSELRRGELCVHRVYGPEIAYNAGNTMYLYASHLFYNNIFNLDDRSLLRIFNAFAWENVHMSFAQAEELLWSSEEMKRVTEGEYLQETMSRIAFLSFRGPLRVGAIIAGASEKQVKTLETFGELIGLGYHLHGDILNLCPLREDWGKVWGEDITEGRRTLLVSHTLEKANSHDKKRLIEILNTHTKDRKLIREAIDIMNRYGAIDYTKKRAMEFRDEACEALEDAALALKYNDLLRSFADFAARDRKM